MTFYSVVFNGAKKIYKSNLIKLHYTKIKNGKNSVWFDAMKNCFSVQLKLQARVKGMIGYRNDEVRLIVYRYAYYSLQILLH